MFPLGNGTDYLEKANQHWQSGNQTNISVLKVLTKRKSPILGRVEWGGVETTNIVSLKKGKINKVIKNNSPLLMKLE